MTPPPFIQVGTNQVPITPSSRRAGGRRHHFAGLRTISPALSAIGIMPARKTERPVASSQLARSRPAAISFFSMATPTGASSSKCRSARGWARISGTKQPVAHRSLILYVQARTSVRSNRCPYCWPSPAPLAWAPCSAQTYLDNETQYSNQDPNTETRRSDHFRLCFGHFNRDTGTPMTEQLAQGNLQMYEQMWNRWVVEMGLHDINESATKPGRQQIPRQFQFPDDLERWRWRRRLFQHGRQRVLLRHGQFRLLPLRPAFRRHPA